MSPHLVTMSSSHPAPSRSAPRRAPRSSRQTLAEKHLSNKENLKQYRHEKAWLDATGLICQIMERQKVTRTELAKRLGVTQGAITQILSGTRNLTLALFTDVLAALGQEPQLKARPLRR